MNSTDKFIMALDSGTTSCRTIVFNQKGEAVSTAQLEFTQYFPHSGWVEHDPLEIWNVQLTTLQSAKTKAGIKSHNIAALGITNQRETVVVWDKESGIPVYNAIVWQDRRTSDFCDKLIGEGWSDKIREKTGLIINPYFSATKIKWILDNVEGAREKAESGRLIAGTIDTWLIWKLTNGKVHATDVSNASRTMLFNINTLQWDEEILKLLEIPKNMLPTVKSSCDNYGTVLPLHFSQKAKGIVPILGVAGDQQSALFGQLCFREGMVKNTYGTGCFTLMNIGNKPILSKNQLVTTIAWKIGNQPVVYALEGSVFVAGSAIQWLRDGLRTIYNAGECDFYCELAKNNDLDIYMVPSFTGLGAPYWDSNSRGAFFGLERGAKREDFIKATVESIAYQSNDLLLAMQKDVGKKIEIMKVDGGASNCNYLMQFQASISDVKVERPTSIETTALGAAYLAGIGCKYWTNEKQLATLNPIQKTFTPNLDKKVVEKKIKGWNEAVKRTLNWTKAIA